MRRSLGPRWRHITAICAPLFGQTVGVQFLLHVLENHLQLLLCDMPIRPRPDCSSQVMSQSRLFHFVSELSHKSSPGFLTYKSVFVFTYLQLRNEQLSTLTDEILRDNEPLSESPPSIFTNPIMIQAVSISSSKQCDLPFRSPISGGEKDNQLSRTF